MQQRQIYTSFDSRWKQVVSKDDILQAFLDVGIDVEFERIEWMEKRNSNSTKWRYCPNSIKWYRFCCWCKLYQYSNSRKEKLNDNLLLFFTGFSRFSADIQQSTTSTLEEKKKLLDDMLALVDDAQDVLENTNRDLDDFGRLLDKTWKLKRQTGKKVSKASIDEFYEKGIAAGALGGKLLGAGGGGFLLFYVQKDKQEAVRDALKELMEVPFKFENQGTRVIYYSPEAFDKKTSLEK